MERSIKGGLREVGRGCHPRKLFFTREKSGAFSASIKIAQEEYSEKSADSRMQ